MRRALECWDRLSNPLELSTLEWRVGSKSWPAIPGVGQQVAKASNRGRPRLELALNRKARGRHILDWAR